MSDDTPDDGILDKEEFNYWLKEMAETCLAHMYFMEQAELSSTDAEANGLGADDYGLLELERGFLALYSLYKKGSLPPATSSCPSDSSSKCCGKGCKSKH